MEEIAAATGREWVPEEVVLQDQAQYDYDMVRHSASVVLLACLVLEASGGGGAAVLARCSTTTTW